MTNYLQKINTQNQINNALAAVNIVQTRAMNAKLERLNMAQNRSNLIQTRIAQINLHMAVEQKKLTQITKKILDEQVKQTKILEIQTKLAKFKIDFDIEERKQEEANKEKISNMMEVVFQATEDLEKIPGSDKHNIEKFFQIQALLKNCTDAGVATNLIDDIDHKKYIKKCLNEIGAQTNIVMDKLTEVEKRDLETLIDILSKEEAKLIKDEKNKTKKINEKLKPIKKKKTFLTKEIRLNQKEISKINASREALKRELEKWK